MPAIRRRWTAEAVRSLMDESRPWPRYELIDGELLVTPAPGSPHQLAVGELYLVIAPYIDQQRIGVTFLSPADLELRPDTITQPDVFVVPGGPGGDDGPLPWSFIKSLHLAVEVLSPSSLRNDRVIKRDHFMDSNVAEYWVVDIDARAIERWMPGRETPVVNRDLLTWHPVGATEPLVIDLSVIFARVREKVRRAHGGH